MTHTPGPWYVDSTHVRHAINTDNVHIAMANIGPGLTEEEALANARLIAAAPELYDLLNEWLDTPFFETKDEWQKWVDDYKPRVLQAIAKAEGE